MKSKDSQESTSINLEKGYLIFNTERENGYAVVVVNNTNKGVDAQYWMDDFLHPYQRKDEYHTAAKNYLTETELESLGRIVNAYLDLAEDRAKRNIPMTMEDWAQRLDKFLEADDWDVLQNSGKITALMAKVFVESEFEKYRIVQDRLFESDFDKEIKRIESKRNKSED